MVLNVGISSFVWQACRLWRRPCLPAAIAQEEQPIRLPPQRLQTRSLPFQYLLLNFSMPERIQKPAEPAPWGPKQGDGGGPRSPDVSRPDTKDLLKKMRKVDPNQSKRYRQRTGE
jgi:Prokaryotic ubiquitin-like protein UBact